MRSELSWADGPDLLTDLTHLELTPRSCDLDYWMTEVVQGTLTGLRHTRQMVASAPDYMRADGPLRRAAIHEAAFRSLTETMATRCLSQLAAIAPDSQQLDFILTVAMDEARHARIFRQHLSDLDVSRANEDEQLHALAGQSAAALGPIEAFALEVIRQRRDYIGGVLINTVLVEGLLAPAAALSERKWRSLDPGASEAQHATGIDEARHLTVGTEILRTHLAQYPAEKARLLAILREGFALWDRLPHDPTLVEREAWFQQGMLEHRARLQHEEFAPGVRLLDTTPETRAALARSITSTLQLARLTYIGLC